MKKIACIGFDIPSLENDSYIRYDSHDSLSDFDIAIFHPTMYGVYYHGRGIYNGKDLYSKDSSVKIQEHANHWTSEIVNLIKTGKNVFVILCSKKNFFIHTGQRETSGTGRNQKATDLVKLYHNYNFLPIKDEILLSKGKIVNPVNPIVKQFHEDFKELITYESHIKFKNESDIPLFSSRNNDKVLGAILKRGKGSIVLLPEISFDHSDFSEIDEETENKMWTSKGIQVGKRFVQHIVKIDKVIRGELSRTPPPSWLEHKAYELVAAEETKKKIKQKEFEITSLQKDIENFKKELAEQEELKGLMFETGKALEKSVIVALKLLGFQAENYDDGVLELDQVITSPEDIRYIGECEGKDKSHIDVNKFRQLQDALNEDFHREEIEEKAFGILFGNPQRLLAPSKRTLDFTVKCKKGAEREKIALIKTPDLFKVAKYLLENKNLEYAQQCRSAIYSQLGKVVKFPTLPKK